MNVFLKVSLYSHASNETKILRLEIKWVVTPLVAEEVSRGLDICIGCEVHTLWEVGCIYWCMI